MKKLHLAFFALAAASLLFSCKKDDNPQSPSPVPTVTGYKLNFKYVGNILDKIEYVASVDASAKTTCQYYPNGDLKTIVNKFSIDGTEDFQRLLTGRNTNITARLTHSLCQVKYPMPSILIHRCIT